MLPVPMLNSLFNLSPLVAILVVEMLDPILDDFESVSLLRSVQKMEEVNVPPSMRHGFCMHASQIKRASTINYTVNYSHNNNTIKAAGASQFEDWVWFRQDEFEGCRSGAGASTLTVCCVLLQYEAASELDIEHRRSTQSNYLQFLRYGRTAMFIFYFPVLAMRALRVPPLDQGAVANQIKFYKVHPAKASFRLMMETD
jgi:hypothetical protein